MKKILLIGFVSLLIASCSTSKKEGNMIINGQITGLKKGTLYLQKMKDTLLVTVDSVALLGTDVFRLSDDVTSPELYYLTFSGNTANKYLLFFGEAGNITINDDITKFGIDPKITGSKNQELLDGYNSIAKRYNDQNLDLIKQGFVAQQLKNKDSIDLVDKKANSLLRRRILFATNYAVSNADYEVAPYIALTALSNANIKLLDTVNNSLSESVKNSIYGKKLANFIATIKKNETDK
jgi:hypothetical protein